jgi:hypothetical protein
MSVSLFTKCILHRDIIGEIYLRGLPDPNLVHIAGQERVKVKAVQEKIKAGLDLLQEWVVLNSDGKLCDPFRKVLSRSVDEGIATHKDSVDGHECVSL